LKREFILTLSCPDTTGIVYAVSGLLFETGCNIIDSQQFGDSEGADATQHFFMRVHFSAPEALANETALTTAFEPLRKRYTMALHLRAVTHRSRVMLLVSQHGHCLNDLLFRWKSGHLPIDIPVVVSNHRDFEPLVTSYGLPFHHLPLADGRDAAAKQTQEAHVQALAAQHRVDLLVLARYMQVLSHGFCEAWAGRAINIHHSFLPSFKGAKPYAQAHARGVKLIGATAHYVTADLDEGPIIEQDVARVDHSMSTDDLTAAGRDVECAVLSRAVRWHVEHRVLINAHKTVIFT
jgi:formyltetrahydrofolate deformylase